MQKYYQTILMSLLLVIFMIHASGKEKQPNVLLIFTDDHRYSGVHSLANEDLKTPNLDALGESGLIFTRTYLMGAFSGATCMPSRAMLMTGRNVFDLDGVGRNIPKEHQTIGECFQQAGYQTHHVGKWHQDNKSLARSFHSGAVAMGLGVYLTDHYRMPLWDWDPNGIFPKKEAYLLTYNKEGLVERRFVNKNDKRGPTGTETDGPHTSEIFADKACEFINEHDKENPFFMYLAFHAPHDPRQAPQKYRDLYPVDSIQLPPSYQAQHPFDNGHMVLRDEELGPWPRTPEIARQHLADYYAIITHLDAQIGRVIESLKKSGEYENTIIVMSGDSGLAVGCHGLLGKQNVYDEDGLHVPLILSGKINGNGKRFNTLSYIHDIYPTICDLAGINTPDSVKGRSLLPVIKGEKKQIRDHSYHAYRQFQRAYRKGEYKLIEYVRGKDFDRKSKTEFVTGSRVTQLFNIKNDPWETTDLSFFPQYRELVQTMQDEMKEQAVKLGDKKENVGQDYDFWDYM